MTPSDATPAATHARRLVSEIVVAATGSALIASATVAVYLAAGKVALVVWWLA